MIKRDHPCKPDCPERSAECRLDCPEWAEYEAKRNADYARYHPEADYADYRLRVANRIRKRLDRDKWH